MFSELLLLVGSLIVVAQQVSENLWGGHLKGAWMRLASIVTTAALVVLAGYVGREVSDAPAPLRLLGSYSWFFTLILGGAAGVLANVWHGLVAALIPGANGGRLFGGR